MIADINSETRLVQQTFADHLERVPGRKCIYTYNPETVGLARTLVRASGREVVTARELRATLARGLPPFSDDTQNEGGR